MEDEVIKHKIFLDSRDNGIRQPNGTFSGQNASDYYLNIPLYLSFTKFDDYINIDKDNKTVSIDRNNFNPFYIELGFFGSIKATSTSGETNLNSYSQTETIYEKSKIYQITINK